MDNENTEWLLLDEEQGPVLIEDECKKLQPILAEFMTYYAEHKDEPVDIWLERKMQEELPDRSPEEIQKMTREIVETLEVDEANQQSLSEAVANGRRKEDWYASKVKEATSEMSTQDTLRRLSYLDNAIEEANTNLYRTITTRASCHTEISQNPRLDGFIAEQYHAQTFNMNAEASGSPYRAKVLEPEGKGYAKNSVDIEIIDGAGKVVKRYQSKYCKNAEATRKAFEHGDYRGQQKLVPEEQISENQVKATTVIEAPDGTRSNPLTKSRAELMRDEAQSGNWNELNWNEYATKDLVAGIGKQAGYAAIQGAAIGIGFDTAQRLWNGEEFEVEELIETAIESGSDCGVKAAAAGALKVGIEKEIITVIPKGISDSTIAHIVHVAIEDAKVLGKMATGELSVKEGMDKIEQTTVATMAGLATMGEGAAIGATIGVCFGPIGLAVGTFVGGTVGYMFGSKVGENIAKGAQKMRDGAVEVVKELVSTAGSAIESAVNVIGGLVGGLLSIF